MTRVAGAAVAMFLTGCACEPISLDNLRFACGSDDHCAAGRVCVEGECRAANARGDGGTTDAGTTDAGTTDAGPGDAGTDAGSPDAGSLDAGASDDGGTDSGTPDAGDWWDARFTHRRRLTITTTNAVDADYAVSVRFNHAAMVTSVTSRANGDDVRVVCREATWVERDRALDTGRSWNATTTTLWFRVPSAIASSSADDRCYLYYGHLTATAAPANRANIFLFFDDFETNSLAKWSAPDGGLWQTTNSQRHGGSYSVRHGAETDLNRPLVVSPALDVANVYLDAWWYFEGSVDVSQAVRIDVARDGNYQTNLVSPSGWDLSIVVNGSWSQLSPNQGSSPTSTWTRVGLGIEGTRMRVFLDEAAVTPANGSLDVGTDFGSGNIGIAKWYVGSGWWVDDVVARPWVEEEPTVLLGPEE